jgi:AraC-like DNA-binding protein
MISSAHSLHRPIQPVSPHADKLFTRICGIIKDRFADPDFGPSEVAAEAGISLRYLQKLFTSRNSTCTHFIHSVRLDYAGRLLQRRALLNTSQPISEVAYDSGFSDYTHFARKFRRRLGHLRGPTGDLISPGRHRTAESASLAHDVYPSPPQSPVFLRRTANKPEHKVRKRNVWVSSDFEGKLVIVTGAGSGMGAVTARRFRDEGAAVVLTGSQLDQERRLIHVSDVTKSDEQQDSARQY